MPEASSREDHRAAVDALLDSLGDCRGELANQEAEKELLIDQVVRMSGEISELRETVARLRAMGR